MRAHGLLNVLLVVVIFITMTILLSCGKIVQSGTPQPLKSTGPLPQTVFANETPEYGGKVSFLVAQTGGFDPSNALTLSPSCLVSYEGLVGEDWTKGPSGSGVTPLASNYTPPEYFTGWLAQSWTITDPKTITYSLRRNIHFQKKPPVNGRELTADDVVFTVDYYKSSPRSGWSGSRLQVTVVDKYTVRFVLPEPNPYILFTGYNNLFIIPREVVNMYGDLSDWRNMNTTGPYFVEDVVPDSTVRYTRNADHWQVDPFRPQNRLPYIEKIDALVITDTNLQLAALKSGRIDRLSLTKERADNIMKTKSGLKQRRLAPSLTNIMHMRTDIKDGPFANVQVRQALSMAIDREAIVREYYLGDAVILNWPFQQSAGPRLYTPLDELPADLRELYTYSPDRAKQLLAAAGYPRGFKATINLLPGYAGGMELYSFVKEYFDAIGVETTLLSAEFSAYWTAVIRHTYTDMSVSAWGNGHPSGAVAANSCGYGYNYSVVCDDYVESERQAINVIASEAERNARLRELGFYLIEQQYYIELPSPYTYIVWQPWLKGQSGEIIHGSLNNWFGYLKFSWVDSKLKAEGTGK
jgi:peptide/nickel transport system substrate-binding protein